MSKLAPSPDRPGIFISDSYRDWQFTQIWLVEAVRTVASRMFAQISLDTGKTRDKLTAGVHRVTLTAQVSKLFGALFDENDPRFEISWIVDLLVYLGDLGHIGRGYYLPRESRIVRITERWGRIAGGLPMELSEHAEGGIKPVPCESIGRVVRLDSNFNPNDQSTEYSEVFSMIGQPVDRWIADLYDRLPKVAASPPPEEVTFYYNPESRRTRTRGERWQNKFPIGAFVVARTGGLPLHYSIHIRKEDQKGSGWFEVTNEEARKWVLLAERIGGVKNRISARKEARRVSLLLPDMLPKAWNAAIFACASTVVPNESGWTIEIQDENKELVETLLGGANIELI